MRQWKCKIMFISGGKKLPFQRKKYCGINSSSASLVACSIVLFFEGSILTVVCNSVLSRTHLASFGVPETSPWRGSVGGGTGLMIECSSRPQKKVTAHHRKTRPGKTQPWEVKRKPTVYTPLPPFPADWTLFSSADEASSSSPQEPRTTE